MKGAAPAQLAGMLAKFAGQKEGEVDLAMASQGGLQMQGLLLLAVVAWYLYQWWSK